MLRYEFDDVRLTVLPTGTLRLDGGAMFGVVPKPLWEREHAADQRNRILLAMNVLLVEDGKRRILIDTGAGEKWDAKERDIFALETSPAENWLKPAGLAPADPLPRTLTRKIITARGPAIHILSSALPPCHAAA